MLRLCGVLLVAFLVVAAVGSQASRFQINARGPVSLVAQATAVVPEQPRLASSPGGMQVSFDVQLEDDGEYEQPSIVASPTATAVPTEPVDLTSEPEPVADAVEQVPTVEPLMDTNEQPATPIAPDEEEAPALPDETPVALDAEAEQATDLSEPDVALVPDWWAPAPAVASPAPVPVVPTDTPVETPEPTQVPDPVVLPVCPVEATVWFSHRVIDIAADDTVLQVRVELPDGQNLETVSTVTFVVRPDSWQPNLRMATGWRDDGMFGDVFALPQDGLAYLLDGLAGDVRVEVQGVVHGCDFAGSAMIEIVDSRPATPVSGESTPPLDASEVIFTVLDPQ